MATKTMGGTLKTTMTPTVKMGRTAGGGVPAAKTTLGRMKPTAAASAGTTTPYIGTMPPLHGSCHKGSSKEVKKLVAMGEGECNACLCVLRLRVLLVRGAWPRPRPRPDEPACAPAPARPLAPATRGAHSSVWQTTCGRKRAQPMRCLWISWPAPPAQTAVLSAEKRVKMRLGAASSATAAHRTLRRTEAGWRTACSVLNKLHVLGGGALTSAGAMQM